MFEPGNIVYHDDLVFNDNQKDNKEKRPCVVLFSILENEEEYICTCPLTSQIKSFNKFPKKYCLIKEIVYNYKKLSFASISNISLHTKNNTHYTSINVDEQTVNNIRNRLKSYNPEKKKIAYYNKLKEYLNTIEQQEALKRKEEAKQRKYMRNLKRKTMKQSV